MTYCVTFAMFYPIVTTYYLYFLFKQYLPQENRFNLATVLTPAYLL